MAENDCLFCKIVAREIPSEIVHEDDRTMAFLDVMPRAPGHTVVIAKHHNPTLLDLPDEEIAPLFRTVKTVAARVREALAADGLTFGVNQGSVSGQTIPHLHVHILPRFGNDGGGSVHSVVNNPPKESIAAIGERIRKHQ